MSTPRRVDDVDWSGWTPTIRATLLFVVRDGQILLIRKKRGLGAGKINGPGGKLDAGETPLGCALRETEEEVGLRPFGAHLAGRLFFEFTDGVRIECWVFRAAGATGEARETEEATPLWTPVDAIPYDEMWADDREWLPALLAGRPFLLRAVFTDDVMHDHTIEITGPLDESAR